MPVAQFFEPLLVVHARRDCREKQITLVNPASPQP